MLSEEERKEIEEEREEYAQARAAAPGALLTIQRHRGWVSDEAVRDVAEFLEMAPEEIESIATFYSMIFRQPVGRHVICLCDSVSCWIVGFKPLLEHLRERLGIELGETTPDNRFTMLPIACLGACDVAPAIMIDEDLHGNLTPEKLDEILKRYP